MGTFRVGGRVFRKSSFSPIKFLTNPTCVAVSISDGEVLVTNTRDSRTVLSFTHQEWDAFIKGAKNKEFDL